MLFISVDYSVHTTSLNNFPTAWLQEVELLQAYASARLKVKYVSISLHSIRDIFISKKVGKSCNVVQ